MFVSQKYYRIVISNIQGCLVNSMLRSSRLLTNRARYLGKTIPITRNFSGELTNLCFQLKCKVCGLPLKVDDLVVSIQ